MGGAGEEVDDVAIVVVNYGSHAMLDQPHVSALTADPSIRITVVDSFHSEAERAEIARVCRARGCDLVPLPDNPGFGAGVNAGVAHAIAHHPPDAIVLLNPDAVITPDSVRALAERAAREPMTLVGPEIRDEHGRIWFAGGQVLVDRGETRTRGVDVGQVAEPWITGACMVMTPALWDLTGGFDERYFMYWEDIDLCWRARRLGARVVVDRTLRVIHLVGRTQGTGGKSGLYRRFNTRNRLLFAATHLRGARRRAWVRRTPSYGWKVMTRDGRRPVARRPMSMLWPVLRGSFEGLLIVLRTSIESRTRSDR